jgi:hypothetical protein
MAPVPTLEDLKPESDGGLQARLLELQRAEEATRRHMEQQQRQIAAAMLLEKEQPKPPELSQRDLEFIGARPGVEKDPGFLQMAQGLPMLGIAYGSDRFYRTLESAFPLSDFRRVEQPKPEPDKPSFAEESEGPAVSAPISRDTPSMGGGYRSPTQYRLSPTEREIAKASGMSEVEYARNRLRLEDLKRRGLVQDMD